MIVFSDPAAARVARAIARDDDARVRQLLAAGVDLDATGVGGIGLLGWALVRLCRRPFVTLLEAGTDVGRIDDNGDSVVHYAAIAADPWYLEVLLRRHIDVDIVNLWTGRTPLMEAVSHRRHEQSRMLLAAGADADIVDRVGETSLHLAAEMDDYSSVLDLLHAGASPVLRNHQGATFQRYLAMTPSGLLTAAARRDRVYVVTWLRDHDIAVDKGLSAE